MDEHRTPVVENRSQNVSSYDETDLRPMHDLACYLSEYARQRPTTMALACFGLGFILGWRLKPW